MAWHKANEQPPCLNQGDFIVAIVRPTEGKADYCRVDADDDGIAKLPEGTVLWATLPEFKEIARDVLDRLGDEIVE